jgi:hypothetical protein
MVGIFGRIVAGAATLALCGSLGWPGPARAAGNPFDDHAAEMAHARTIRLVPVGKGKTRSESWSSDVRVVFGRKHWVETSSDGVISNCSGRYAFDGREVVFKLSKASKETLAQDLRRRAHLALGAPIAGLAIGPAAAGPPSSFKLRIEKIKVKGSASKSFGRFEAKTVVRFVAKDKQTGKRWKGKYKSKGKGRLIELGLTAYTLDVSLSPPTAGTVSVVPDLPSYGFGSTVALTAEPALGYTFFGWSGDVTGGPNPLTLTMTRDWSVTALFAAQDFDLEVRVGGLGVGRVSGGDIDCGTDCETSLPAGSQVTLTASASPGSVLSSWQGCDESDGNTCTFTLDGDRTVSAIFAITGSQVVIQSLPDSDPDGGYVLTWRCLGFVCSTSHAVQEANDLAFSSPTTYSCGATAGSAGCVWSSTPSFVFSGKENGTWCYRVRDVGVMSAWSQPACVTVARPAQVGVLHLVNETSYDLLDIRVNGQQMTTHPQVIPAGGAFDFVFDTPGSVHLDLGNGYWVWDWDIDAWVRDVWFTFAADTSVALGGTTTITVLNPSIGQMLTRFQSRPQDWTGPYYDNNGLPHYARLRFSTNGAWSLLDSPQVCALPPQCIFQQVGIGLAEMTSWPPYSLGPSFRLCPSCEETDFLAPFGVLNVHNGPASHPWIQYTPD